GASGPRVLPADGCCGGKVVRRGGEVHKAGGGEVWSQSQRSSFPPRPPSYRIATFPTAGLPRTLLAVARYATASLSLLLAEGYSGLLLKHIYGTRTSTSFYYI
ncbi:hypothetical protein K523DRAFT_422304, partial [Schizophyllum commune Tattone D]